MARSAVDEREGRLRVARICVNGSGLAARFAILIMIAAWAIANPARAENCSPLPTEFDYSGYRGDAELLLEDIASLPSGRLFLSGRYIDAGNTIHPALLVSDDGKTWSTVLLPFSGAGLRLLRTQGTSAIWGVVSFRQEGSDVAELMLRSLDGGRRWCVVSLNGLMTLESVETFRFFDAQHGLIVFSETRFGIRRMVYHTSDGGDRWQPLWPSGVESDPDVETEFGYPGNVDPPAHTPVWRRDLDLHRIGGLLRARRDDATYIIEQYDYQGTTGWTELSRIGRHYRIVQGQLAP